MVFPIFREMKLFGPKIKTFLYFFREKLILYFRKWNFLAPRLKISEGNSPSSENKKNHSKKNFLYFWKWKFLALRLKSSFLKRVLIIFEKGTWKVSRRRIFYIFTFNKLSFNFLRWNFFIRVIRIFRIIRMYDIFKKIL